MYYSTWVFVNLVAIFRIFEIVQNVPQVLPKSCEQFRQNPIFRFRLAVILKISMKIKEIHVLQYMGFCQFGCDFPNFRNLSKTFLRYSRKVVSSFVRTPSFVSDWQKIDFKNFDENQRNPCTIVHGFLSIWLRFSEFSKLSKTFLRYSRKVVSSFVRTPFFVSDWQ